MNNPQKRRAKEVLPLRFIDTGNVSYLRSQTIYHGLAYAKRKDTPDTIILNRPIEPYVCIGFHGNLKEEVDIEFCNSQGIPILRRETGGGTVYLDKNQLFTQWIFSGENFPHKIESRFLLFTKPIVETYRYFDINAYSFPPNDVHVKGKKIVGTGAATIGKAEVMTGNFLFDFDCDMMSKILLLPDDHFRKMTYDSLTEYMTSIKVERGKLPSFKRLKAVYIDKCESLLERPIIEGEITENEMRAIEKMDEKFASEEWLYSFCESEKADRLVKIQANIWLFECSHKTKEGGSFHLTMRTKGKLIDKISIKGNFSFLPEYRLLAFEKYLKNVEINKDTLKEVIESFYELHEVESPGIIAQDWADAILKIKSTNALTPF